jgi:type I restriction enzyme M protein
MGKGEIVQKLWNLCNVLRDDGITYHQYVTELTYILFLKMLNETNTEKDIIKDIVGLEELRSKKNELSDIEKAELFEKEEIETYSWDKLVSLSGIELKKYYNKMLNRFGTHCKGHLREIYHDARSNIDEPKNLEKIITNINNLDWYDMDKEGFGDLYEGLLEKNANEKKSGAGQYFTPRVLIDVMTELVAPELGELCNDPACGTFGFMIAANKYVREHNNDFGLSPEKYSFQKHKAFTGCELVQDTHRLALMNAMIHGIDSEILLGDTLSNKGKAMKNLDVVLTNPPFGTKKGGETASRDDFTFSTSNKQLNFLQHIYRSLKANGKARAAVVLPDNVLFADGDGARIREDLMDKCNLHTILRLPTGIFYAQGVKTNVMFFTREKEENKSNTKEVWFYDMRTNMPSFGKTTPLKKENFEAFIKAYTAEDRTKVQDERFSCFTREQIAEKNNSLDLGLIRDDSIMDYEDLQDPIESGEEIIAKLEEAVDLIQSVVKELRSLEGK